MINSALLDIHPRKRKHEIQKDTSTPMFISSIIYNTKAIRKQPNCPWQR